MTLITRSRYYLYLTTIALFLLFSCKKNIDQIGEVTDNGAKALDGVPAYYFDWEVGDYMPPASANIFYPWHNGSIKGFSSDIWYDIKKSDGWELVYNRFNPNETLPPNPFFILYNKYRGLFRIYIYITTPGFPASNYLTDGLNLAPNAINSSMLNFIGQDIIDVSSNKIVATQIESTQLSTGVWYASQFEIAYDPNIAASTYQQIGMNYTLKWTNISTVDMQGSVVGSLNGTISTPSSGFNLAGNAVGGALQVFGLTTFSNNAGPDADHPGIGNGLGLPSFVFDAIKEGLSSGVTGIVKNVFNAIMGGNSNSPQQVNLTLNAKIKLTGSITGSGAIIPDPGLGLGVPGTSNSQSAGGLLPYYDEPMGVFNINHKPVVNWTRQVFSDGTVEGTSYRYDYTLVTSSFDPVYNPAVLAVAQIQNYSEELFTYDVGAMANYATPAETIGGIDVYYGSFNVPFGISNAFTKACVRVSFDVVPNNGAPRSKIVKTFACTLVRLP